ncbi:MAG: hypothetical protein GEU71_13520 [Actinobacteria bacterium]|jgi:hypothetical protein|nr:hypothetical protein [Actinomycetota bacterium]
MDRDAWVKAGLWFLVVQGLFVGVWALFFPSNFFTGFPGYGRTWVSPLGDFNEHLVTDVGGFNLAFAFLFGWAAVTLDRKVIVAGSLAFLLYALPHLSYHLAHSSALEPLDRVLQNGSLLVVIVIPGLLAWTSWKRGPASEPSDREPS